jgi:hypothetical protein
MAGLVHKANVAVAKSFVGKYFRLEGSGHVRTAKMYIDILESTNNCPAQGTQGELLLYRVSCWLSDLFRYGIHHLCQL